MFSQSVNLSISIKVRLFDVPVALVDLEAEVLKADTDLCMRAVVRHVNGVSSVSRIAQVQYLLLIISFKVVAETERERQRETERDRDRETDRDRQRETETDRDKERERDGGAKRDTGRLLTDILNLLNYHAQLAEVDVKMVCEALRHLLYYRLIDIIDIFQFSNRYRVNGQKIQVRFPLLYNLNFFTSLYSSSLHTHIYLYL